MFFDGVNYVEKAKEDQKSMQECVQTTFQEFQDQHNIDTFYYDLAGDLLTPYRAIYELGPWIAGGFLTRALQGETLKTFSGDIDVFFHNEEQKQEYIQSLEEDRFCMGAKRANQYKSDYASNFIIPYKDRGFKLQCVTYKTFTNIDKLLGRFDLFSTMFGTDGVNVFHERLKAINLAKGKVLEFNWDYLNSTTAHPDARFVLKRYSKFIANGYKISDSELGKFAHLIKGLPIND